jgi:hypothetical protein
MAQGLLGEIRFETPPLGAPAITEAQATRPRALALPRSRAARLAISLGLLAAACAADVLSGDEVSASLFYVVAIFAGTWLSGGGLGAAFSLASTLAWLAATLVSGHTFSSVRVLAWNLGTELTIYLATALAVAQLRHALERSRVLVRTTDRSRSIRTFRAKAGSTPATRSCSTPTGCPRRWVPRATCSRSTAWPSRSPARRRSSRRCASACSRASRATARAARPRTTSS